MSSSYQSASCSSTWAPCKASSFLSCFGLVTSYLCSFRIGGTVTDEEKFLIDLMKDMFRKKHEELLISTEPFTHFLGSRVGYYYISDLVGFELEHVDTHITKDYHPYWLRAQSPRLTPFNRDETPEKSIQIKYQVYRPLSLVMMHMVDYMYLPSFEFDPETWLIYFKYFQYRRTE